MSLLKIEFILKLNFKINKNLLNLMAIFIFEGILEKIRNIFMMAYGVEKKKKLFFIIFFFFVNK